MKSSYSDRIKITKRGKIVRKPMGTGHFRSKLNGKGRRNKNKMRGLNSAI